MILFSGLFEFRVGGNEDRLIFFNSLVSKCIDAVRDKVFFAQFKR